MQFIKGAVPQNIAHHLKIVEQAIAFNADLIIFPELSITGYEPQLAKALACDFDSPIFQPFQELSDKISTWS